ncbi:AzlC family ABC transporter permease [Roseomonas sp. AR75]|jgi:4-azaleucine resistance transporter AzlC|uniref:AzlC family ABC transporter permease n=1 Tax=Roseomonas sp. AR75 TaxID=2562311 RepID=UPI00148588AF|nr:AzlC family ABC transporter permease [Roseomonas sp. AR75]
MEETQAAARRVIFTRNGVWRGVRDGLPLWLGMLPFGLVIGVLADGKGLSFAETVLMSALVYAGAAQLVVLELWQDPVPIGAVIIAAFVVNIRMAPMGAALASWLDRLRGIRLWGTLWTMVDHSFALSIQEQRRGGRDAGYLLGIGAGLWVAWVVTTAIGYLGASAVRLPPGHPLYFAGVAAFISILVGLWRGPRADLLPWLVAAAVAVAAHRLGLPVPLPLLAGTIAGATLGAWFEMRRKATP